MENGEELLNCEKQTRGLTQCKRSLMTLSVTSFRTNVRLCACREGVLLYIELSNSFLIGRKRTVNFRNQRPCRYNCRSYNRPFPSSLVPLFQSESKCESIVMKITLICMRMKLHAELIFIWKVSHLDSFWNGGIRELGNGLLSCNDTQGHGLSCHVWPRCMISKGNHVKIARFVKKRSKTITSIYFRWKYNKTITRFGICDILNNRGLGNGYRLRPSVSADNLYLDLDYSGYLKNLIQ